MSLYVRIFTNFYSSRKTAHLQAVIGTDAFWVPPRIWAYAAENQPDGNLEKYSAQVLANLIGYTGDATRMHQALLEAGFIDPDGMIHDWFEHNGYHANFSERAKAAADARWAKKREREEKKRNDKKGKETSIASSMLVASEEVSELNFPQNLRTEAFTKTWAEWVAYRKQRAACKDWLKMFQKQLDWLGTFPEGTAKAMLDQSIRNNWQGIIEIKSHGNNGNQFSFGNGGTVADKRNAAIIGSDRVREELETKGDADDLPFLPG
jgi:hypothetical protein